MKHSKLVVLALLLHAVAFAQSLKVEICNNSIVTDKSYSIEAIGSDTFSFTENPPSSFLLSNTEGALKEIELKKIIYDAKRCDIVSEETIKLSKSPEEKLSKFKLEHILWLGKFAGAEVAAGFDVAEGEYMYKLCWLINDKAYEMKISSRKQEEKVFYPVEICLSPDGSKMVYIITDQTKSRNEMFLINNEFDVLANAQGPRHSSTSFLNFYENKSLEECGVMVLNNEGVLFYRVGSSWSNGVADQKIWSIDFNSGVNKELTLTTTAGGLDWAFMLTTIKGQFIVAPVVSKKITSEIIGFAFWQIDYFNGAFKEPEIKLLPAQVIKQWNDKVKYTSMPWGDRTGIVRLENGAYLLVNKSYDIGFNPMFQTTNHDLTVLHFNSNNVCDWGQIIARDIQLTTSQEGNKTYISHAIPEFLEVIVLDSSVVFVYHTEASPARTGPRVRMKYKAALPQAWITTIGFDGKVYHHQLIRESGKGVLVASVANPIKQGDDACLIRLVLKQGNSYDAAKIDLKVN